MLVAVWQLRATKDHLCESIRHMHGSVPHPGFQILQLRALQAAHLLLHSRTHCLQILARHQPARDHSLCQLQPYEQTLRGALSAGGARASAVESQSACLCGKGVHARGHELRNDMRMCVHSKHRALPHGSDNQNQPGCSGFIYDRVTAVAM